MDDTVTAGADSPAFDQLERMAAEAPPPFSGAAPGADDAPPATPDIPTRDVLLMLLGPLAQLAPNWQLTGDELGALADGWAPVVDKYFPDVSVGVELNAAIVTVAVMASRFGVPPRGELPAQPGEGAAHGESQND